MGYSMTAADLRLPSFKPGPALRVARRVRGMKQSHAAEYLRIGQPMVSRIERGEVEPGRRLHTRILDLVMARLDPARDAGLRRLIDHAGSPVHLICDVTHRLLAASLTREQEWQRSFADLRGRSLWGHASMEIHATEATLVDLGWGEVNGIHTLTFVTGANLSQDLRIMADTLTWDRVILADGSAARIVTGTGRSSAPEA